MVVLQLRLAELLKKPTKSGINIHVQALTVKKEKEKKKIKTEKKIATHTHTHTGECSSMRYQCAYCKSVCVCFVAKAKS